MPTPRPDQAKVIAYDGGQVAVAAVPGAGKTFVLKELAARLIEEKQARPSQLLMLTYMRTGALNLRERIQAELAARGRSASGLRVLTIHAFCHQLLSRHAAHRLGSEHAMISGAEQRMLLTLGLEQFLTDRTNGEDWVRSWATAKRLDRDSEYRAKLQDYSNSAAGDAISAMKAFRLPLDKAVNVMDRLGFPEVGYLIKYYVTELGRRQLLDYDDLVSQAITLLEEQPELAAKYQRQYRFVLEDEAQDSTFAQQELLRILTAGHGNLMRVGDTNQAILSTFTFNDPKFFRDFLHKAERLPLSESGRSAPAIQRLANKLVEIGLRHPLKERINAFEPQFLQPSSTGQANPADDPGAIRFQLFPNVARQDRWLVEGVQRRLDQLGEEAEEGTVIGILTRSNKRADAIGKALADVGIEVWMPGRPTIEADLALEILADVIRFLTLPPRTPREGLLTLIWRILDRWQTLQASPLDNAQTMREWMTSLDRQGRASALIYPELFGGLPGRPTDVFESDYVRLINLRDILRDLLTKRHLPLVELIAWACERLFTSTGAVVASHRLAMALRREVYRNPEIDLVQACDFVENLVRMSRRSGKLLHSLDEDSHKPPVMVTTVHQSKGMEFDTVFVVDVTARSYGWTANDKIADWQLDKTRGRIAMRALETYARSGTLPDPAEVVQQANMDEIGEGLRLLYVALTRAKSRLVIASYPEVSWQGYNEVVDWPDHVRRLKEWHDAENQTAAAE